MLTQPQNLLYFRLFGAVKKVKPDADRHEMHRAPSTNWPDGLPASHTAWNNDHFDEWKARCLAITQPANYQAQQRQVVMPQTRWLVTIGHVMAALQCSEAYVNGIIATMTRKGAVGGHGVSLETLQPAGLEKLHIALKKECRRRWPRKADLLGAIREVAREKMLDDDLIRDAALSALQWETLPRPETLDYEKLLVVLGVVNRLSGAEPAEVTVTEGDPF